MTRPPGTWRLLAPALVSWALVAGAVSVPGSGILMAGGGVLVGASALGIAAVRRRRAGALRSGTSGGGASSERAGLTDHSLLGPVLLLAGLVIALGVRMESVDRARSAPGLRVAAEHGTPISLTVTVTSYPGIDRNGQPWMSARTEQPSGPAPVVVWCGAPEDAAGSGASGPKPRDRTRAPPSSRCGGSGWGPGSSVTLIGEVAALDPGGSAAWGIRVHEVQAVRGGSRAAAGAARLREGLRAAAVATPGAELVPGLAVGDTTLVSPDTDQQMRDASLTHLVAVSGANCALVTSAVGWALAWAGAGRRVRILGQGAALAGFVFVVGPDPSVQRAAVMAAVVLLSGYGGKRAVALPALGSAIVVLLLRDPWQALHPGFALSVAATAGILLAVPTIRRVLVTRIRVPAWLALPVAVAIAAQLACGPLLLLLQPGLPIVGVLANVLAAPAAPFGTGTGLLALVLLPLLPQLGHLLVALASWSARWLEATAAVTAALPGARLPWPDGWAGALLLAGAELALALAWWVGTGRADRSGGREPWGGTRRVTPRAARWGWGLAATGLGALLGPTLVSPLAVRAATPGDWSVVACDVGQGDALLLRDPAEPKTVFLVDTGDDADALMECLDRFGVDRLAALIISHDHQDHFGAIDAVLGRVDRAIVAPAHRESEDARPLLLALAAADVPVDIGVAEPVSRGATPADAAAGTAAPAEPGSAVTWRVLGPPSGVVPANANASSLVLHVELGELSVLLLGDTGATEHAELMRRQPMLRADVVKVAHHGSRDQAPELAARVGAELGLVSVGAENRYGHPARETLAELAAAGTATARTDRLGHIAVSGSSGALRVWGSRAGTGD